MLTDKQIAALHSLVGAWADLEFAVIGATALDLFGLFAWRQTDDLDVSIAISVKDIDGDVAAFAGDADRRAIADFLARSQDGKDHIAGTLVSVAPPRWRQSEGTSAAMLEALAGGFGDR